MRRRPPGSTEGRWSAASDVYKGHGGLYAESQLREHMELLRNNVFGNPHSLNPTSRAATVLVEQARAFVFEFFHASPDEYAVIFTSNASNALKLLGESYPFKPGSQFLLLFDNHNSVNGIREFARAKGASYSYLPVMAPELRVDESHLSSFLEMNKEGTHHLFAYPAQSNFTGVQHPLEWIAEAQNRGWDVLLDGAAFVPTNRLDLARWHPDFVPLSFYKLFGYPTGVGCLLARKAAAQDDYPIAKGPYSGSAESLKEYRIPRIADGDGHRRVLGTVMECVGNQVGKNTSNPIGVPFPLPVACYFPAKCPRGIDGL